MKRCSGQLWNLTTIGVVASLLACNAILGNDPRRLDPGLGGAGGGAAGFHDGVESSSAGSSGRLEGGSAGAGSGYAREAGQGGGVAGELGSEAGGSAGSTAGTSGTPGCAAPQCEPDDTDSETQPCGVCGGTQTRSGTCSASCRWQWDEWSSCVEDVACHPGDSETQDVTCPCAGTGTKRQTRSCTEACEWGGWTDTTSCDIDCCSFIKFCDTKNAITSDVSSAYPARGTWCCQPAEGAGCSDEEVLSDCTADVAVTCPGGVSIPEFYVEYR